MVNVCPRDGFLVFPVICLHYAEWQHCPQRIRFSRLASHLHTLQRVRNLIPLEARTVFVPRQESRGTVSALVASMKALALLTMAASAATAAAASSRPDLCPAEGSQDSQGRESCNPAKQYADGFACNRDSYCFFLMPCAPPGRDNSIGRSCDPNQQYPAGQICARVGGCHYLAQCNADGQRNLQSSQNCELGRKYPEGSPCAIVSSGCLLISAASSKGSPTSISSRPSPTASCPAPGSPDSQGRVGCDPKKQSPSTQTCRPDGGCFYIAAVEKSDAGRKVEKAGASPSFAKGAAALALAFFLSFSLHICI